MAQSDDIESAGYNEALTLLRFGLEYGFHSDGDVQRVKYWRKVKQLSTNALSTVKNDTEATFEMVSLMKEAGVLSTKALRTASELVEQVESLNASQLTEFVMIYSSAEMQTAIDVTEHLSKLESALLAKSGELSVNMFGLICSIVCFDDAAEGAKESYTLQLPVFLHENEGRVKEWLAQEKIEDMQDFVNISAAYLSLYEDGEVPEDLLNLLEKTLENQAQSITASDAINLVQVFSSSGSSYTLELLDRVIGNNIDQVPAQQAYDAFMAFSFAKKADVRPKIGALLMRCISENLFEYTND